MGKNKKDGQQEIGFDAPRFDTCGHCQHWKAGFCKRNAPATVQTTKFDEALYIARWPKVDAGEVACGEFMGIV